MPNNTPNPTRQTVPAPTEIPVQDPRPAAPTTVNLAADVVDFLTFYTTQMGDLHWCVNSILRRYRDSLPAARRVAPQTPSTAETTARDSDQPPASTTPDKPAVIDQHHKRAANG